MPGRYAVLLHGQYPTDIPPQVLSEALGFTGPEDLLVLVRHATGSGQRKALPPNSDLADLDGPLALPGIDGISSPVKKPEAAEEPDDERGGHGVRRIYRASEPDGNGLPTIAPTEQHDVSTPSRRAALPLTAEAVDAERAAAKARSQQITDTSAHHLGLRLDPDARGVTFNDIQRVAAALRCTAELLPGHEVMLKGRTGERYCRSFAEACKCLNGRTYNPAEQYA